MMDKKKYSGVIPAFYACYDKDGNICPETVEKLTEFYVKKGVLGLYVGGSSGECIYQSVEERKLVLEHVMKVAKGKLTVIAHVACNNTRDSMELAAHAESLGVDAIAAIPPIYFKLPDHAIAKYWNDISSAAPNTDFIIYNIPQLAGVALTPALFKEMLKNPRVIGVKNSSMPSLDIWSFKNAAAQVGRDAVVFNGPDEQLALGRLIGAEGGIGGTYGVMPELFLKLDELLIAGENEKVTLLQARINEIIVTLCSGKANLYAVMKEIIRRRDGIDCNGVRSPLANLAEGDYVFVEKAMAQIEAAKKEFCE